jgi:hypothetical protein
VTRVGATIRDSNPGRDEVVFSLQNVPIDCEAHPVLWASFPRVKRPASEADHGPLSSAKVRNEGAYASVLLVCVDGEDRVNFIVFYYAVFFTVLLFLSYVETSVTVYEITRCSCTEDHSLCPDRGYFWLSAVSVARCPDSLSY